MNAKRAVDGDLSTAAHTKCRFDADLWFKMKFDNVYCFFEVVIIQSRWNSLAHRMDDLNVVLVDTETESESLCGVLKVTEDWTLEGQTYRIPCDLQCGDEIVLTLRHDEDKYTTSACIHIKEIMAFSKGFKEIILHNKNMIIILYNKNMIVIMRYAYALLHPYV